MIQTPSWGVFSKKMLAFARERSVRPSSAFYRGRVRLPKSCFAELNLQVFGPELYTKLCLYDVPPDRNFVLGALPEHPRISVFVGAGHGYKFASLAGKVLSESAIGGETEYPIGAFRPDRPALTDPNYEPAFNI